VRGEREITYFRCSGSGGTIFHQREGGIRMAEESIQVLSTEKRTFPPSKEFSQKAHIKSMKEYEQLYKRSVDDPEKF
jgi:hypothetical protein